MACKATKRAFLPVWGLGEVSPVKYKKIVCGADFDAARAFCWPNCEKERGAGAFPPLAA